MDKYVVSYPDQWGDTATRTFRGGVEAFRDAVRFASIWQQRWRRAGKPENAAGVTIDSQTVAAA